MGKARFDAPREAMRKVLDRRSIGAASEVVVAFSGGADSLALLLLLEALPKGRRPAVEAVHVDHGLRPDSAAAAEAAVALALRIAPAARQVRVAVEGPGGIEAAARQARYRALAAIAGDRPILTAHSADDQAETVLLRLARGSGTRGLVGIREETRHARARVIRPLLTVRRAVLHQVVRESGFSPVEDPSNRDLRFARNRIRAEVLPALERAVPGTVPSLARTADLAAADERYLEARAEKARARLSTEQGLDAVGLARLPLALRRRIVRHVAGLPEAARVDEILSLVKVGRGEIHLPGERIASVEGGFLRVGPGVTGARGRSRR